MKVLALLSMANVVFLPVACPLLAGLTVAELVGDGRLDQDRSADFRTALRELVEEGRRLLGMSDEKSPA